MKVLLFLHSYDMECIEVWKPVAGYEGRYEVSNYGRVKSLNYDKTGKERLMALVKHQNGRLFVGLYKDGKQKALQVSRIVGYAFIPNPFGLPEINHKDENPENNCVENLEWCDKHYNCNYGTRNERIVDTRKKRNPDNECYRKTVETRTSKGCSNAEKRIVQYSLNGEYIGIYNSVSEAERATGIGRSQIRRCSKGILKQTGGYRFEYA